jgi:hypothetical protein
MKSGIKGSSLKFFLKKMMNSARRCVVWLLFFSLDIDLNNVILNQNAPFLLNETASF